MRKILIITILIAVFSIVFLVFRKEEAIINEKQLLLSMKNISEIKLKTDDNINLVGTFYKSQDKEKGVILLHMLGRDKLSWKDFSENLLNKGFNVLAIDLRGHGQSDLNWQNFSEEDFRNMVIDAKSALEFLKKEGIKKIFVIGASIGANTAINFGARFPEVSGIVALSPSFDYRGIKTKENIKFYSGPIMIVSSEDDKQSFSDSQELFNLSPSQNKKYIWYKNAGHGTLMFNKEEPNLDQVIINWLNLI